MLTTVGNEQLQFFAVTGVECGAVGPHAMTIRPDMPSICGMSGSDSNDFGHCSVRQIAVDSDQPGEGNRFLSQMAFKQPERAVARGAAMEHDTASRRAANRAESRTVKWRLCLGGICCAVIVP